MRKKHYFGHRSKKRRVLLQKTFFALFLLVISSRFSFSQEILHPEWGFQDFSASTEYTVTDLTAENVQAEINEAAAHGGGTVIVPEGTILLNTALWLKDNVKLKGTVDSAGNPKTVFLAEKDAFAAEDDHTIIRIQGVSNVTVENVVLDGNHNFAHGIGAIYGSQNVLIANNVIKNIGITKIETIEESKNMPEYKKSPTAINFWQYDGRATIRGNKILNVGKHGIALTNRENPSSHFIIQNNSIDNCYMGMDISTNTQHAEILGNVITRCLYGVKIVNAGDIVFHDNSIYELDDAPWWDQWLNEWNHGTGVPVVFQEAGEWTLSDIVVQDNSLSPTPGKSMFAYWDVTNSGDKITLINNNNIPPENARPFLNYSFIGAGYEGIATTPSEPDVGVYKPYVPDISIDENKIIWVSPVGGGDGSAENSPTTFESALNLATEGTTIIALDGEYSWKVAMPEINHLNIISKNKWGAKIHWDKDNALDFGNTKDIHHISIIGFEAYADEDWSFFIFAAGDAKDIGVHHIYISDMNFHDIGTCIYSGLHSHDWTVDRCIFHDSRREYLWYMMGWHQTVMNSIMYNNSYYSLSVRGHYPLNEKFDYYHPENNIPITERQNPFLDKNDWTHLIVNNTFGSCLNATEGGSTHLVIFYNKPPEDPDGQGEDVYFPPQNILIANNVFFDNGSIHKKPINIFAERGINTGEIWSVNGVYVLNNVTPQSKLIIQEDYTIESIDQSTNNINAGNLNFVDKENHDYRLTAESTDLVDKGTTEPYFPNNDHGRCLRDIHPDVGAWEYYDVPAAINQKKMIEKKTLTFFPNPAADVVQIMIPGKRGKYMIVIYDIKGREVKRVMRWHNELKGIRLDIHDLAGGLYVSRALCMQKGRSVFSGKFIVSR